MHLILRILGFGILRVSLEERFFGTLLLEVLVFSSGFVGLKMILFHRVQEVGYTQEKCCQIYPDG
jgi:hypothetical protein